jgi:hypothetical protein
MIISHKYRFIFIKTIKTAGTSIEAYLSPHCDERDIVTPLIPPVEGHIPRNHGSFYNHYSAWGARQVIDPAIWKDYFKFCVERNPWDKTVSDFSMNNARAGNRFEFQDYFSRGRFCRSWELYTDDDGSLLVNRVLHYENLNQELGDVFSDLGIPWSGNLDVWAKSGHRVDRKPYQEWYSPEQAAVVAKVFAEEIKAFGYVY